MLQNEIQAKIVDEAVEAALGREIWPDIASEEHVHPIRALTAFSHIDEAPFPRTHEIIPGFRYTVREVPAALIRSLLNEPLVARVLTEASAAQRKLVDLTSDGFKGTPSNVVGEMLRGPRQRIAELEERLRTFVDGSEEDRSSQRPSSDDWNADRLLTTTLSLVAKRSSVSWGYIDLTYSESLISRATTPTLLFALIAIDNSHKGHGLVRENHHSGYHYHYVHASNRRSDVLLTFGKTPPDQDYPVTWERHGEGHAAFSPDVARWGLQKRESLNRVCCANAEKLGRAAFRTAGRGAQFLLPI